MNFSARLFTKLLSLCTRIKGSGGGSEDEAYSAGSSAGDRAGAGPLLGWLQFGKVPVAVADPPFYQERLLTGIPLHARIHREMKKSPVITPDEATLVSGAHIYSEKCAVCHGFHGKPSKLGGHVSRRAAAVGEHPGNGDDWSQR